MNSSDKFLSTPFAVLLGSFVIAVAILIHGGFIKIDKFSSNKAAASPSSVPAAAPTNPAVKTQADYSNRLKSLASKVGLDQSKFDACLDSSEKAPQVQTDLNEGSKLGVSGTPATFVNGYMISGAQPYSVFKDTIDFLSKGGSWNSPDPAVKYLVDGNINNGEIDKNKVEVGVGNLPVLGNVNAPITIVEFSDYECPFCGRFFSAVESQLKGEYIDTGKVKFYYRDFPLSQIHPGAQKGAEAARCAGDQGKYWEYHDLVFENQSQIF